MSTSITRAVTCSLLLTVAAFLPSHLPRTALDRRLAKVALRSEARRSWRSTLSRRRAAEADDADAPPLAPESTDAEAEVEAVAAAAPAAPNRPPPPRPSFQKKFVKTAANPVTWKNGIYAGSLAFAVLLPAGLLLLAQK